MSDGATVDAKVRLAIVRSHIAFARHPVHYEGDAFAGAEAQLDRALRFRLTERRRLGLYPGLVGSATIILDSTARPCGAVVVGLGQSTSASIP
jgi:hypothetical protein